MDLRKLVRQNGNGNFFSNRSSIRDILSRSSRAVCGAFEKEVIVRNENVGIIKARLKSAGFIIVGTGRAGQNSTKIWFNPAGVSL